MLWRPGIAAAISKHAFPSSCIDRIFLSNVSDAYYITQKHNVLYVIQFLQVKLCGRLQEALGQVVEI